MDPKVFVNSLTFSDGSILTLEENNIVVFVGPNNAGKSASLKEIEASARHKISPKKVLREVEFSIIGNIDDIRNFFELTTTKTFLTDGLHYRGLGYDIPATNIDYYWNNVRNRGLDSLTAIFVKLLSTETRLAAANPPQNINTRKDPIQHPIHLLQKDDAFEEKFSSYFKQAFGKDLLVHRNAGNEVPLHIGDKPPINPGEDRISNQYLGRLEELPLLHEQGDGMRSFVGVLLHAFISTHTILLIDEPEAFLHPPQARLLGKMLSKDLPAQRQLFLSTHSEYFLKGLLDSNNPNLKIIRIQREDHINKVSVLSSKDIDSIWNDSLLRHSNILNGLFHSKVIVCESDSDCRFYSAILDSLYDGTNEISPDILFIHCGGKHRIPVVIRALRSLNVPIAIITDFDVLNNINPLRSIYEELGGIWQTISSDWNNVKSAVDNQRPQLESEDVKQEINRILTEVSERIFPENKVKEITTILKSTSAWSKAKEVGKNYLPAGQETQAYNRLTSELEKLGLYIVEIGELECFVRSIGNHGPSWVNEVLTKDLKNDPELENARRFVRKVTNS
ncbi:ATP-dependent nuclease [Xanthocytophaga flava]|uniref:ATP-dependent nuclease n=1 Tax=Xanthocytophaga flava TaxID=3048013 RepID=UPI0028D4697C|nr:AAA family ATPase [Xanthocytophaga flavus]MDJ1473377.1 AAA family ATPase [Xanthocytophaga flavus]